MSLSVIMPCYKGQQKATTTQDCRDYYILK